MFTFLCAALGCAQLTESRSVLLAGHPEKNSWPTMAEKFWNLEPLMAFQENKQTDLCIGFKDIERLNKRSERTNEIFLT